MIKNNVKRVFVTVKPIVILEGILKLFTLQS